MDGELEIILNQNIFPCGCQTRCICKKKRGKKPLPNELKKPLSSELKKPKILTEEQQEKRRESKLNYYYRNREHFSEYSYNYYWETKNTYDNIINSKCKQGQQSIMEYTLNPIKLKIIKPKMSDNQINKSSVILVTTNTNKNENTNILTKVN